MDSHRSRDDLRPPDPPPHGTGRPERLVEPGSGRRTTVVWLAVLACVIGAALLGRIGATPQAVAPSPRRPQASPIASPLQAAVPTPSGLYVENGYLIIPSATVARPRSGSAWLDTDRIVVTGHATGAIDRVLVTVLAQGYLLGQIDLTVSTGGSFTGAVTFLPPTRPEIGEIRVIDPGPPARLMRRVPVRLGAPGPLLLSSAAPLQPSPGGTLHVSGLVLSAAWAVQAQVSGPTGTSGSGTTAHLQRRSSGVINPYLGLWRSFTVSLDVPPALPCGGAALVLTAVGIPADSHRIALEVPIAPAGGNGFGGSCSTGHVARSAAR